MAKDFKKMAAGAKPVYNTIIGSAQDAQEVHGEQHVQAAQEFSGTQGRKGAKLPRINMAFPQESLDFLRVMSSIRGQSITRYVNDLIEQDMLRNAETYEKAKQLVSSR